MDSESLEIAIISEITAFRKEITQLENEISRHDITFEIIAEDRLDEVREDYNLKIKNLLIDLYKESPRDNYYFFDCPFSVYKSLYEDFLKDYLEEFLDADETDFLKLELNKFYQPFNNRIFSTSFCEKINYDHFAQDIDHFRYSLKKKRTFLREKLLSLDWETIETNDEPWDYEGVIFYPEPLDFRKIEEEHNGSNILDNEIQECSSNKNKLQWEGNTAQLGFLFGNLIDAGYLNGPRKKDGEINYSEMARQLIEHFNIECSPLSLAKYLNSDSDKAKETYRRFREETFHIPHIKSVS